MKSIKRFLKIYFFVFSQFCLSSGEELLKKWQISVKVHPAVCSGKVEDLKKLIAEGADVNIMLSGAKRALHFAAEKGDKAMVEALVEAGAGLDFETEDGMTALHYAAASGHKDIVVFLLSKKAKVMKKNGCGETALHLAVLKNHFEIVHILADHDAADASENLLNRRDESGETALHKTAHNPDEKICDLLLSAKARIDITSENGSSALLVAAGESNSKVLRSLLRSKANVNQAREDKRTALHLVAEKRSLEAKELECLRALIFYGADENAQDAKKNSPSDLVDEANKGVSDAIEQFVDFRTRNACEEE